MRKRRFSLLLVPQDHGEVKRLWATSTHVWIVMVCLFMLLATTAFLAVQYLGKAKDAVALARLRRENS
ncbi:hypothetical protein KAX22_11050, partial [bacterium]|nr:hypothetical protein [bacterium]